MDVPESLQRHYDDAYAETAVPIAPPQPAFPVDRIEACRVGLSPMLPPDAAILELAAGSGELYCRLVRDEVDFVEYVLTEISRPRLEAMRELVAADPRARVMTVDAEALTPEIGMFDAVVMVALIEHLIDPIQALRCVREVLRPGGFVWIDTPNIAKWTRRLKLLAGKFPSTSAHDEGLVAYNGEPADLYDEGHLHYWSYRSLEQMLLKHCGFARVERHPYPIEPLPLGAQVHTGLARRWPTLMAEVCVTAHI